MRLGPFYIERNTQNLVCFGIYYLGTGVERSRTGTTAATVGPLRLPFARVSDQGRKLNRLRAEAITNTFSETG